MMKIFSGSKTGLVFLAASMALGTTFANIETLQDVQVGDKSVTQSGEKLVASLVGFKTVPNSKAVKPTQKKVDNAKLFSKARGTRSLSGDSSISAADRALPFFIGFRFSSALWANQIDSFDGVREQLKPLVSNFADTPLQDSLKLALDTASKPKPDAKEIQAAIVKSYLEFAAAYKEIDPAMFANLKIGTQVSSINSFIPYLAEPTIKVDVTKRIVGAQTELLDILIDSVKIIDMKQLDVVQKLGESKPEATSLNGAVDNIIKMYSDQLK
jgi:hypothetical protein